jgi:hypothetical protein
MPIMPGPSEDEQTFIGRCMSEETNTYPQDQAYAICKSKWDNEGMSKHNMSYEERAGVNLNKWEARLAVINLKKEGVNLAAYPWEQCIADQTDRYGEEAAPRICGYIKSEYGS